MKRRSLESEGWAFPAASYFVLTLFFFITIYPFYYIFIYSISDVIQAQKGIFLLPAGFTLDSYVSVFKLRGIFNALLVSVARTVLGTALTITCSSFCAYILSKRELLHKKLVYRFFIVTMYLDSGLIPYYLTMRAYGLKNSFLLYVVPSAIGAFYIILMKTYMEQLPEELEEAATIDGAGFLTRFTKVVFPLSKPVIATIVVFAAVGQWNSWMDNFLLVENAKLKTLQLILFEYINQANSLARLSMEEMNRGLAVKVMTPQSIRMTITMVVTLPILFVYPLAQKYFVKGIMLGAIKG
jgi:putative aldouronate transport system permease protein